LITFFSCYELMYSKFNLIGVLNIKCMKQLIRVVWFSAVLMPLAGSLMAQDFGDIMKGSIADSKILIEGYIAPAMNALGDGMNQGWYNTAKVHKTLGVDFTITGTLMYVPSSEEFYTVNNNKLQEVKLVSYDGKTFGPTESGKVPTIFGPQKAPQYQVDPFNPFNGPEGLDMKNQIKIANALPTAMYHLGIGLPKGFDLKIRWSPTVKVQDFRFSLFGIGVMHDVKQYIKGIKMMPFDLSVFVGYTKMKFEDRFTEDQSNTDVKAAAEFNSTTIQALISKKISVVTFYGGVGYNIAKSSVDMRGTYDLDGDGNATDTTPFNLDFSSSGVRATGGIRLKLAVITLHGDYTLSKYNAFTAGFGINVR